jgi:hypothetical protein
VIGTGSDSEMPAKAFDIEKTMKKKNHFMFSRVNGFFDSVKKGEYRTFVRGVSATSLEKLIMLKAFFFRRDERLLVQSRRRVTLP